LQKFDGTRMLGSAVSTRPSQSLSTPSHTSVPEKVHAYSQPLPGRPSRLTQPARHCATVHAPPEQPATAWSRLQPAQLLQ
jgi:hypothetical protein